MRTNKLHAVRFRGVCSVIELSEKRATSTSSPPRPKGLNQTKTNTVGVILTALFPAEVANTPVGR